jgi:methionyl-tRNA formyltransferase
MRLLIFSLGLKGFLTSQTLAKVLGAHSIHCVIGHDPKVVDDYSSQLIYYCQQQHIAYSQRKDTDHSAFNYDFAIAIGWRWMIEDFPSDKLIIFHDSLLPKYRGFAPLVNALINKEKVTGVTALFGVEQYDRGHILLQKSMPLFYPTTISSEIARISMVYTELAVELVTKIRDGQIALEGYPQDENQASYSLWRDDGDYRIDWEQNAEDIGHFVRCVGTPYLGASARLGDVLVRVFETKVVADVNIENRSPGKVIFIESEGPVVVCGQGLLMLLDVRDELGESVLPLKSFRSRFQ